MQNQKNSGGNKMSDTKGAKRRIALLSGSSLVAAGLAAAAVVGAVAIPTAAAAQSCTPTAATVTASGPAADTVTCTAGVYPSGITYSSNGNLGVNVVANGATVNSTMTTNGVNLTGNGSDSISWNSTVGNILVGNATVGPVLDVQTATGDITITTAGVSAGLPAASVTHAIRAVSTGGGDITISRSTGAIGNTGPGGIAAVEATTAGGNISISGPAISGRLRGILAQTSGAGTIAINITSNVSANATDGVAAIDTVSGAGATTITYAGTISGGAGAAIRSVSAGSVTLTSGTLGIISGRVNFAGVAGGVGWTGGQWNASGASIFSGAADTVHINFGTFAGGTTVDFGAGADTFRTDNNLTTGAGTISFGAGADVYDAGGLTATGTTIAFGADNDTMSLSGVGRVDGLTLNFGSGADVFNQNALLMWTGGSIDELEAFNNTGTILLGPGFTVLGDPASDGDPDDVLSAPDSLFTGSGDSLIVIDAVLSSHGSQLSCVTPTVADCVSFGSTAGSTLVQIKDFSFDPSAGSIGTLIVLVEGSSAAEHFVLDPESDFYAQTAAGAAIRKAVTAYYFVYDEANQRHVLVGAPTDEPQQVGTFAASAQEIWRSTTGTWFTRQADLRIAPGGLENARGAWGRIGGQSGEREAASTYSVSGVDLSYDLGHKQRIAHVTFGADLLGATTVDSTWVFGGMLGMVRSDVDFTVAETEASFTGFTGGLYASYIAGPLFVDGTITTNIMHVKADTPLANLGLDVPMRFDLKTLGGQVEGGWRIGMGSAFVEPLVGASYVVTRFEDAEVPGGASRFEFDNAKSLRFGGGARVGMDSRLMGMTASYSLTGRYWNETMGENSAEVITASGSSAVLLDEFIGNFSEVAANVSLYGDNGLSGFVNIGGKFADGYDAVDGALGVRFRW
jgi:putative surface-exposed virulence protein